MTKEESKKIAEFFVVMNLLISVGIGSRWGIGFGFIGFVVLSMNYIITQAIFDTLRDHWKSTRETAMETTKDEKQTFGYFVIVFLLITIGCAIQWGIGIGLIVLALSMVICPVFSAIVILGMRK